MNIVCIASGRGSNLDALLHAFSNQHADAHVVLVISNNSHAEALTRARAAGVPALHLSEKQFSDYASFAARFVGVLRDAHADLIVLAGYLRKLPDAVCKEFRGRIINIHPALLPKFGGAGMFGIHVHEAVLAAGEKESGATVHFVDEVYDNGKIILQKRIPVLPSDTPETLAARVLQVEHEILVEAVLRFIGRATDAEKAEGGTDKTEIILKDKI